MRVRLWRPGAAGCARNDPANRLRRRAIPCTGPARPPGQSKQQKEINLKNHLPNMN